MPFVLDVSVVLGWYLADEAPAPAEAAFRRLGESGAAVPALWWFEVRNALLVNERRHRLDDAGTAEILASLAALPIHIDRAPQSDVVLALARAHRLTVYDAAYLELARRRQSPLATLDRALAAAARAATVPLFEDLDGNTTFP